MKKYGNLVLNISLIITILISVFGIVLPKQFESIANVLYGNFVNRFGWFYILAMLVFVIFCFYLLFSKKRNIVLGKDGEKAEYSLFAWFGMLFCAGMGVGLVFWGAAEPLSHFVAPIAGIEPGSEEAIEFAFRTSFLHWGIHPWANYVILALGLAYMQFRKDKKGLISSIFIPIFGDDFNEKPLGKVIDIISVFATVAGLATSLGLGALQINSGLNFLFGIPENNVVVVIIIILTTIVFTATAVAGIDKGIKIITDFNIRLAVVLMAIFLVIGPTRDIFINFGNGLKGYLINLPVDSLPVVPEAKKGWIEGWTIFYWAWWIAWAPFVSTFIARISRGRTIKEFVSGCLLAPTIFSMAWFAILGSMGTSLDFVLAKDASSNVSLAFFKVLQNYPLTEMFSALILLLLVIFFITSANSGTFVLGMFSTKGDQNPKAGVKVIWGALVALITIALLTSSTNGLQMLQTISLAAALPIGAVMLLAVYAIYKMLKNEKPPMKTNVEEVIEDEVDKDIKKI